MVATVARIILENLDMIPNVDKRTRVAFLTFDKNVHFYRFKKHKADMLVYTDSEDPALPSPCDLLVNLLDYRNQIEEFLSKLGTMHATTQIPQSGLGSALKTARSMIGATGGKIIVFQTIMPNFGVGMLKEREDPSMLGTIKEALLLNAESKFYKDFGVECTRDHVCVDMFLFPSQYVDVASLAAACRVTGGSIYFYPGFSATRTEDVTKLAGDLGRFLGIHFGLEAVLRVRASKGISICSYHGNFFTRQADLLSLANVNPDHSFSIEMKIEETLSYSVACIQTALLHTTSSGERRIRVLTLALPVTSSPMDILNTADAGAIANILAKNAGSMCVSGKLDEARDFLFSRTVDVLAAVKGWNGSLFGLPEGLKALPVLSLGAVKSVPFRAGTATLSDVRASALVDLETMSISRSIKMMNPRLYAMHYSECFMVPLVGEALERNGIYLMDDGCSILYLWIGIGVSVDTIDGIFGVGGMERIPLGKTMLPELDTEISKRLRGLIEYIDWENGKKSIVYVVRDVSQSSGQQQALFIGFQKMFSQMLVEERSEWSPGYSQWLGLLRDKAFSVSI